VANIPAELRALPQWVVWRYTWVAEKAKWDKPPLNARSGRNASTTSEKTWSDFETAKNACDNSARENPPLDGLGLVLVPDDPSDVPALVGADLDHCRNPGTGVIDDWALEVVKDFHTYTEVSPSGCGLRLFCRGQLPPQGRKNGNFEIYDSGRYVTVTGQHLGGTPLTIERRQEQIGRWHTHFFPPGPPHEVNGQAAAKQPLDLDDAELLRKAEQAANGEKFKRLWSGSSAGYPSPSEADCALCGILAFWVHGDTVRIDRLFRQSDRMRAKWDEKRGKRTYGQRTIARALKGKTEFYQPAVPLGTIKLPGTGAGGAGETNSNAGPQPWEDPIPLEVGWQAAEFPLEVLPGWIGDWVAAEATATQTPPALAAMLALTACGAALARGHRVEIRPGWSEPTNIMSVVSLAPGERKSKVYQDALKPVYSFETAERQRLATQIAESASERRILELRQKNLEGKASKAADAPQRNEFKSQAKEVTKQLAAQVVLVTPELIVDDITPEKLQNMIVEQGGRILQAAPEGTLFDMVRGRYGD
jgi:hypothetical protein